MEQTTDNTQTLLTEPENKLPDFTFDQLPDAMRAPIDAMGWKTPMPVQAKAIPYLLDNRDMIVQSRTGSGKTGAFMMPLLMRIDTEKRHPQALVLVPTRELAVQVHKEFETLSQGLDVSGVLVYGGVGYNAQLQALREGAQVVIGTPGRVLDHIGRRALNLDRLKIIVFDEADEMLSMGFYPDMRELRRYLPRERSSWMFSATMPYKVQMLAREFLHEPEFLSLSAGNVNVSTMEHRFYDVPPLEKDIMLMRLIELENPESAIIFCNTKVEVEYLSTVLQNYGYNADQLSGDLDQKSRERAMGRIRRGETRFLVATDVAARGIDISDLSHVFQYDVPKDPDSYVHRAGRTARAGNTGVVVTLVANMSEKSDLKKIARKYEIEFVELPMPTKEEAEARMAERLLVVLEDRFRTGVTRLQRERMKRFSNLIRTLAENDDERMLLAMLLDDLYYKVFHEAPPPSPEAVVIEERKPAPPPQQQRSDRAPAREPRQERENRPAPTPASQPQGDAASAPVEEAQGTEGGRKKKRKRKRNRNRNREGAASQGEGLSAEGAPAQGSAEPVAQGARPQEPAERREESRPEGRDARQEGRDARPEGRDVRQEGRREGRQEGRPEGRQEGRGRQEGQGRQEGRSEGRQEGRPEGENRQEGRGDRRQEGRKEQPKQEGRGDARRDDRKKEPRRDEPRKGPSKRTERGDGLWLDSIEVIEPDAPSPIPPPAASQGSGEKRREEPRREQKEPIPAPQPVAETQPAAEVGEPATSKKGRRAEQEPKESPVVSEPIAAAPEPAVQSPAKSARGKKAKAESEPAPAADIPVEEKKPTASKRVAKPKASPAAPAAEVEAKPKRGKKTESAEASAPEASATEAPKPKRSKKESAPAAGEAVAEGEEKKPKRAATKSAATKKSATKKGE